MEVLKNIGAEIQELIRRLDEDEITDRREINEAKAKLIKWLSPRESMFILRGEMLKDRLGESDEDGRTRDAIDEYVHGVLEDVVESGYAGMKARNTIKRKLGRPAGTTIKGPRNPRARANLSVKRFRFSMTPDMRCIIDDVHLKSEYKISMYEGMTADNTISVIRQLLDAADNRECEGWVKCESWWRGAFLKGVYRRFKVEQIEIGKVKNGHNGYWRLITDGEFDIKSSIGRFKHRCKSES